MAEEFEYDLGSYQGRTYLLRIRGEPDCEQPDDFAVVLRYNSSANEDSTAIARVDTAHGHTHFDKLYRRGEPKEAVDWGLWEAVEELIENWRGYAESYENK